MAAVSKDGTVSNTAVAIFTAPPNEVLTVTKLYVTDKSGSNQTVKVYIDNNGTTYDTTTQVGGSVSVTANEGKPVTQVQGLKVAAGGNLALQGSGGTDNLVFHLAGSTQEQTRDATNIGI